MNAITITNNNKNNKNNNNNSNNDDDDDDDSSSNGSTNYNNNYYLLQKPATCPPTFETSEEIAGTARTMRAYAGVVQGLGRRNK